MNYGKIRDDALRLIGRYSNAGTPVAASYNNQADYINKIPYSINSCLMELASSARKLPAVTTLFLEDGEVCEEYLRFVLPEDCLEIRAGGVYILDKNPRKGKRVVDYILQPPDNILIYKKGLESNITLEYFRRPQMLSDNPADTDPIDADIDVKMAIPYFIASELLLEDDPYRAETLKMRFEDKIERLSPRVYASLGTVVDDYSTCGGIETYGV